MHVTTLQHCARTETCKRSLQLGVPGLSPQLVECTLPLPRLHVTLRRSLEQLDAGEADGTHFAGLIWSCSQGGLMLRPPALAALVGPSLAAVLPAWQAGDRGAAGGGILLVEGLSRQVCRNRMQGVCSSDGE